MRGCFPSGEQIEITPASSRRSSSRSAPGSAPTRSAVATCSRLRGRREAGAGRARCSCPGPTGSRTAATSSPGLVPPPAHRARGTQRDPRPRTLGRLDGRRARNRSRGHGAHAASPARLSVLARTQRRVRAVRGGPAGDLHGDQHRTDACPYASGAHPYLTVGTETVDPVDPPRAGAHRAALGRARNPDRHRCPSRTPSTTSGSRGRSVRPGSTTPTPTSSATPTDAHASSSGNPAAARLTLWVDESYPYLSCSRDPLPSVSRRSLAVEPMTCPPNAFRTGDEVVVLEPGETATGVWGITIERGIT